MDAGASIITLVATAGQVGKKLHQLIKTLRKAPDDIVELLEEVQFVRVVLQDVRQKQVAAEQWFDLTALATVVRRADKVLNEVNLFVSSLVSQNIQEELKFHRVSWYRTREQGEKHLRDLRNLRDHAVALLSCATLSASMQLALSFNKVVNALDASNATQQEIMSSIANNHTMTTTGFRSFEDRLRQLCLDSLPPDPTALPLTKDEIVETKGDYPRSPLVQYQPHVAESHMDYPSNKQTTSDPPPPYYPSPCSSNCPCSCHQRRTLRLPTSISWLTGRLSVKMSGMQTVPCNSPECNAHTGFSFSLQYSPPTWLLYRMVHVMASSTGDPTFVLSVPRVLSQDTPIFELAREGDIVGLQRAFSQGIVPTVVTEHGESLLQYSVAHGKPRACRFLIQAGANPTIENKVAVTPGMEAWDYILREAFDTPILDEFRAIFHDSSDLDERGFTLVHEYVLGLRMPSSFSAAVEKAISMIDMPDRKGRTPLHWASLRGDGEKLSALLRLGANPRIKDYGWGNTPLDYAVRLPSGDCTKLLLERGADVNSRTTCLWTPLYGCGAYRKSPHEVGHVESARYLISWKADVTLRDEDGHDALIKAVRQDLAKLTTVLLVEGRASINTVDKNGISAVAYAIRRQSHKALEVLLDHGADYRVEDKQRNNILHMAGYFGDHTIIQILDRYAVDGINPDATNADGLTAMELTQKRKGYPNGFITAFSDFLVAVRMRNNEMDMNAKGTLHSPEPLCWDIFSEAEAGRGPGTGEDSPKSSTSGSASVEYDDALEYLSKSAGSIVDEATDTRPETGGNG